MARDWRAQAVCLSVGPDWFFPEPNERIDPAVLAVCARCPVRAQCLDYALAARPREGLWAGLTAKELAQVREQLKVVPEPSVVLVRAYQLGTQRGVGEPVVYYGPSRHERWSPGALPHFSRIDKARSEPPVQDWVEPTEADLDEIEIEEAS